MSKRWIDPPSGWKYGFPKLHDTDFDKMNQYYKKIYPKLIEQLEKEGPIQAKARETK